VSTDEKSGIQALQRLHPALPVRPGLVERQEHEYVRHGSRCLIANYLEVATGRVITPSIGLTTRTNEDFASHIARTISHRPRCRRVGLCGRSTQHPPIRRSGFNTKSVR
jgi:hypothetical protein